MKKTLTLRANSVIISCGKKAVSAAKKQNDTKKTEDKMSKNEERNLNVTIKNDSDDKENVVLTLSSLGRGLKKYFLPWIIIAVIAFVSVAGINTIKVIRNKAPFRALISFNYNGIEKGLDPAGNTFDINSVKNVQVISEALIENDVDIEQADAVRNAITFEGVIPPDIIDRITTYQSVYEKAQNGNLPAAQAMLDVTYYPTQFKVKFDYGATEIPREKAVQVFNTMLDNYRDYFFDQYGYNKSLGQALSAVSYMDYDYSEAVDLFRVNLNSLDSYVSALARTDSSHFRSKETGIAGEEGLTGYTFDDISQSIDALKKIDLARISSYVTVNNVTRDKTATIAYYQYNIDELTRQKNAYTERLANLKAAIDSYKKDTVLVMNSLDGTTNQQLTQSSEQYDILVERYDDVATSLANVKQEINMYTQRRDGLAKGKEGTPEMATYTEGELKKLDEKVTRLVEITRIASEQYYETEEFANAYKVLVPAVNSQSEIVKTVVKSSIMPIIVVEAFIIVIYAIAVFVFAIKSDNGEKTVEEAVAGAGGDDDDDSDEKETEAKEKEVKEEKKTEEKSGDKKNSGKAKNNNK